MRRERGFTLIECCFVVGILGILLAIAVPNFVVYQLQAKATEATINLEAIAYLEQVALLETGATLACDRQPVEVPRARRERFVASEAWRDLGFVPVSPVAFQYRVEQRGGDGFVAFAQGDLDGDGVMSEYRIDSDRMRLERTNPAD